MLFSISVCVLGASLDMVVNIYVWGGVYGQRLIPVSCCMGNHNIQYTDIVMDIWMSQHLKPDKQDLK